MLYLNSICKGERAVAHVVIFRWCEFHARRRQSAYFTERPSLAEPGKWYVSAAAFHTAACCPPRSLTVPGNTSQAGSYDLCPRDLHRQRHHRAALPETPPWSSGLQTPFCRAGPWACHRTGCEQAVVDCSTAPPISVSNHLVLLRQHQRCQLQLS